MTEIEELLSPPYTEFYKLVETLGVLKSAKEILNIKPHRTAKCHSFSTS